MRKEVKKILLKLLRQQQQKKDIVACEILRKLLHFQEPVSALDDKFLRKEVGDGDDSNTEVPHEPELFTDARVRSLKFRNFRAFPGESFGVSFVERKDGRENACSVFLVGANSNGKSTICDALEYAYTGDVASVHRLTDVSLEKFLTYGFEDGKVKREDVSLTLKTMQADGVETISLTSRGVPKCTASFFCSDNDVEELERSKEQIDGYLLDQLGYGELPTLREMLLQIRNTIDVGIEHLNTSILSASEIRKVIDAYLSVYRIKKRENEVLNILKKDALNKIILNLRLKNGELDKVIDIKDKLKAIKETVKGIPKGTFGDEWDSLITSIIIEQNTLHKQDKRPSQVVMLQEKLAQMYSKLGDALKTENGLDGLYNDYYKAREGYSGLAGGAIKPEDVEKWRQYSGKLEELANYLVTETEIVIEGFYKDRNEYLSSTMSSFSPSSEHFSLEYSGGHIKARIHSDLNGGFNGSPKTYYNTFRFKLYVIALKISLAFLYMRTSKIIIPIVIDDVFNATDFDNSIKLERFVYHIYKTYKRKVGSNIPLQLIVLSHDEMVISAFRKGAKLIHEEEIALNSNTKTMEVGNSFICGRLFHYSQSEAIKNADDEKYDFANLYLKI